MGNLPFLGPCAMVLPHLPFLPSTERSAYLLPGEIILHQRAHHLLGGLGSAEVGSDGTTQHPLGVSDPAWGEKGSKVSSLLLPLDLPATHQRMLSSSPCRPRVKPGYLFPRPYQEVVLDPKPILWPSSGSWEPAGLEATGKWECPCKADRQVRVGVTGPPKR